MKQMTTQKFIPALGYGFLSEDDNIAISKDFISNRTVVLDTWNLDKKLSDHIGFAVTITD